MNVKYIGERKNVKAVRLAKEVLEKKKKERKKNNVRESKGKMETAYSSRYSHKPGEGRSIRVQGHEKLQAKPPLWKRREAVPK